MASEHSSFDLQSLLADAQDLVDESFVARALLQPETDPWDRFPFGLLYPTEEPFNEIHYSLFCDPPADSLSKIDREPTIKAEPAEDTPDLTEYLNFTHDDSDLGYPDTSTSPAITISSSSPPAEASQLLETARNFYSTEQLDYFDTSSTTTPIRVLPSLFFSTSASPTTASFDSPTTFSEFVASASPITTVSPSSSLSLSGPSHTDIESIHIISEDPQHSTVPLDEASDSVKPSAEPEVHYTFVDPHEKARKRRTKGIKNSTPIACTFCRRRKIRCGGPQEGVGVCKSCIRLNHKGECVFPAVSYRGQRLGGSNAGSKRKATLKPQGKIMTNPPSLDDDE